jgi:hypothetical protein
MAAIAVVARSIASGPSRRERRGPLSESFGAIDDSPPGLPALTEWNFTEFVPASITAYRSGDVRSAANHADQSC